MNNEPVAWLTMSGLSYQQTGLNDRPLYTHPTKTLTDEEIDNMLVESFNRGKVVGYVEGLKKAQEKCTK